MRKIIDSESVTVVNKLTMVSVVVSDMKRAKEFYAEKIGLGKKLVTLTSKSPFLSR